MKKKLAATDKFSSSHSTNPLRLPFAFHSLFFLGRPLSPFKCVSVALTQTIEPYLGMKATFVLSFWSPEL